MLGTQPLDAVKYAVRDGLALLEKAVDQEPRVQRCVEVKKDSGSVSLHLKEPVPKVLELLRVRDSSFVGKEREVALNNSELARMKRSKGSDELLRIASAISTETEIQRINPTSVGDQSMTVAGHARSFCGKYNFSTFTSGLVWRD